MNLELSANYASNVILVKQLRALPGLPSLQRSPGPLPSTLAKMRIFSVLGETCHLPARGRLDLAGGHFQTEVFAEKVVASHLPDVPV